MKKIFFYLLVISLLYAGCKKTVEVSAPIPPPSQISISPTSGATNAEITITGKNLTGATAVSFGGSPAASFTVVNATTITAKVGTGASGDVKVTTPTGTASIAGFKYLLPPPTIASVSPQNGTTNSTISITGTNFTGATAVTFGGVQATSFTVTNETTITAVVGNGASGDIVVTTPSGSAKIAGFTYQLPVATITSVNQKNGTANMTVILTGTNFTGATAVSFGGQAAASFTVANATTIYAEIGTGKSGDITVTTPAGLATYPGFVYFNPVVTTCKLQNTVNDNVVIGFSNRALRPATSGTVKIGVIFVDFNDAVATKTPKEIFDAHISPVAEDFYQSVSYSKLKIEFEPAFQWYRMSKAAASYVPFNTFAAHKTYIQEAISLANANVDFSKYSSVLVVNDPKNSPSDIGPAFQSNHPGNSIPVDGASIHNGVTSGRDMAFWPKGLWFCHEFGHNLGLPDLYAFTTPYHKYVGEFGLMGTQGGKSPEPFGWERWILGWINDNQVVCQGNVGNGAVTLTPIESVGGVKILTIPIDNKATIVVESRRGIGFDKNLIKEGPLVYLVDASIRTGNGPLKVLPLNETDQTKYQATMSIAQTITYQGITITYTAKTENGDVITFEKK
ncbi:MAG: M6 family metalloprotease domain-containing protein [Leadbetterella sp.]|nr:M6 family metalloprotease domain-containing protein [Leadbetterella sp.]